MRNVRLLMCCVAQVRETVRDVCVLHNEQFFAAAQKKYAFIYDRSGIEVHTAAASTRRPPR